MQDLCCVVVVIFRSEKIRHYIIFKLGDCRQVFPYPQSFFFFTKGWRMEGWRDKGKEEKWQQSLRECLSVVILILHFALP